MAAVRRFALTIAIALAAVVGLSWLARPTLAQDRPVRGWPGASTQSEKIGETPKKSRTQRPMQQPQRSSRDVMKPKTSTTQYTPGSTLIVLVEDGDSGDPIPGASVCLGLPGQPTKYGVRTTGSDGRATYPSVPENTEFRAIVSKDGYQGEVDDSVDLDPDPGETSDEDTVRLDPGSGGPHCPPTSRLIVQVTHPDDVVLCVGNSGDRDAYAAQQVGPGASALVTGLPFNGLVEVTLYKDGYLTGKDVVQLTQAEVQKSYALTSGNTGGPRLAVENGRCVQKGFAFPGKVPPGLAAEEPPERPELYTGTPAIISEIPEEEVEPESPPVGAAGPGYTYGFISGGEVMAFARPEGFGFRAEPAGCRLDQKGGIWVPDINKPECVECSYTLFADRDLNPGWSMVQIDIIPMDIGDEELVITDSFSPEPGGDASHSFDIRVCYAPKDLAPPYDGAVWDHGSWRVKLHGPFGTTWHEAFKRLSPSESSP